MKNLLQLLKCLIQQDFLQVSPDGPNVNLAFLDIINDKRKEMEFSRLIHIGTCGLHTFHNAFSHGAKASSWKLKELLSTMYKIFDENPSRWADYESLTSATDKDYALKFCSHRWIENELVARRAQKIWCKYVEIIEFWRGLPKSRQPGKGKGQNKSFDRLIEHQKDVLVPLKLQFFCRSCKAITAF